MKLFLALLTVTASVAVAQAQTADPQTTQSRPDARYQNPSGQDSNPSRTIVKPTETQKPSANPEDAATSTKGKAASQTYQTGKKADASAGCSTPTDAKSAGVDTSTAQGDARRDGNKTVCTTAGGKGKAPPKKSATATEEPKPKAR